MEVLLQIIDADYVIVNDRPVFRIFGKTKKGESVCAFLEGTLPYFYVHSTDDKKVAQLIKNGFSSVVLEIKEVEKYLPIGYQEKRTKLLKLTLNDPSKVPMVRDELVGKPFVKEIFEADILYKYRTMIDMGIGGMKWVKITGNPVGTKTVRVTKCIQAEKIELVEDESNAPLKYLSVDIETTTEFEGVPDPSKNSISMISLVFSPKHRETEDLVLVAKKIKNGVKNTLAFDSEKQMLEEFSKIVAEYDPDIFVGYNINNFDFPFIVERLRENKISRAFGRCGTKSAVSRQIGPRHFNRVTGRAIADVYELIKESASKGMIRLKRYGLGDVSKELLNEDKLDIAHSEITKYWNGSEEQMDKLIAYARKDAVLTLKLLKSRSMLDKFIELAKVSGTLLHDVLSSGESTRLENLLLLEFNKLDFVIPCRPPSAEMERRRSERATKFLKGALVLEPDAGFHTDPVVYLDFKSMYPSILISYNICPTTFLSKDQKADSITTPYNTRFVTKETRHGIIPKILDYLIRTRDIVKKQMFAEKDDELRRTLNAKQYALKIMANAFYGYTGYIRARLYVLDIANTITSSGRYLIQKTRDSVEKDDRFKVVYGDTDSIMVKTKAKDIDEAFEIGKELEEKINKELEGIVKMKIESVFKSIVILTKKRYAGLSYEKIAGEWKEKMMMKGIETVRRDWCDLVSETLFRVLEIILKEQDPKKAFNYVKEVLKKLHNNEIPVEKLVITKSISKSIRNYKGIQPHIELVKKLKKRSPADAPGVGDRVGYVITQGLRIISKRAEDPEYVRKHNLKIDSKYYIESQLLPPLERLFEVMGIDKSELVGAGKQKLLTDMFKESKKTNSAESLKSIDGFSCGKCKKHYDRIPLIGRCTDCGGDVMFCSGKTNSGKFIPQSLPRI